MICTYERTIWQHPTNGFCIISYKTKDTNVPTDAQNKPPYPDGFIRFTAIGSYLPKNKTLEVDLYGEWEHNSTYGTQLKVERFEELLPKTTDGITEYLSSGLLKGIGPKLAGAIVQKFGLQTFDVLEKTPERLLEIKGISQDKIKEITSSYQRHKDLRDILAFLLPFHISVNKAIKIKEAFGADAMFILKNNPFELCNIPGFGFKTVDAIARKTTCSPDTPLRIRGAIFHALEECKTKGHLYLPQEELIQAAYELLNEGFLEEVVDTKMINRQLHILVAGKDVVADKGKIYSISSFRAEQSVANHIVQLVSAKRMVLDIKQELATLQRCYSLSPKQQEAVDMVFQNNISLLCGGPGTGKTTTIRAILEVFKQVQPDGTVLLMAPTGRASRRMSESTGFPGAMTIHKALGFYVDEESNQENETQAITEDLVIIDEFSMVDMQLASEVFKRIKNKTRLLLVGDPDQLPSVGAGNVFRELITCGQIATTELDQVFRQANNSRIQLNAQRIKEGKTNLLEGDDFVIVPCDTSEEAAELVKKYYLAECGQQGPDAVQILTPLRDKGQTSALALNKSIQAIINPERPQEQQVKIGQRIFRLHDRVLQTKNRHEVFNGDIGIVTALFPGNKNETSRVFVDFSDNRQEEYSTETLDSLLLAYSITIHKSQGSEFSTVIIPILTCHYKLLKRNLIYTAITRAKKKVILIGQKKALSIAIHNNDVDKRNTLLANRINALLQVLEAKQESRPPEQLKIIC